jgi:hypothetical protein
VCKAAGTAATTSKSSFDLPHNRLILDRAIFRQHERLGEHDGKRRIALKR